MPRADKNLNREDQRRWYARPENRAKVIEAMRRRRADPAYRAEMNARRRAAYAADPYHPNNRRNLPKPAYPKPIACECCGTVPQQLALDHCHETHVFRGWLCHRCNLAIGILGDNEEGLMRAVRYLQTAALLGRVG